MRVCINSGQHVLSLFGVLDGLLEDLQRLPRTQILWDYVSVDVRLAKAGAAPGQPRWA